MIQVAKKEKLVFSLKTNFGLVAELGAFNQKFLITPLLNHLRLSLCSVDI